MAVRSGLADIIIELRGMTESTASDYSIGNQNFWNDDQLQDILDGHRKDIIHYPMTPLPVVVTGGTLQYFDYKLPFGFLEKSSGGTSIFYIQDSTGAALGTAQWSMDYERGQVTFTTNTLGSTIYATGRSYDINAAASDVWQNKAAHYALTSFNFSTDNHSISREQIYTHCKEMANFFASISGDAIQTIERYRGDM